MSLPIVTRYPNGVGNVADATSLSDYKGPSPFRYNLYANDFDTFAVADWVVSETQAGATQAIVAGDGGLLALVNSAANADLNSIQLAFSNFRWAASKDFVVKARLKVDDATLAAWLVGAAIVDTSPIASLPTDGIFFYKAAAGTTIAAHVRKGGTSSTLNLSVANANDTFIDVAMQYNAAVGQFVVYVNDAQAGTLPITNAPDTQDLTVTIAVANGSGVARTLTCDYIMVAKER